MTSPKTELLLTYEGPMEELEYQRTILKTTYYGLELEEATAFTYHVQPDQRLVLGEKLNGMWLVHKVTYADVNPPHQVFGEGFKARLDELRKRHGN